MDNSENNLNILVNAGKMIVDELSHRVINPQLSALRAQHPNVVIMPFPNTTYSMRLAAGVAVDISLDDVQLIKFACADELIVNRNGNAQLPSSSLVVEAGGFFPDNNVYYYCRGISVLSIICPVETYATIELFKQL